jgi:lycopene cyclase domain-containing protein
MEYTVAAVVAAACVILLDRRLGTRVLRRREFWVFLAVMYGFKLIANGYLTWRPIVIYGREHFLGVRLGTIPLEDFVYGFALIGLSVVLWEYFRGGQARQTGRNSVPRADVGRAT